MNDLVKWVELVIMKEEYYDIPESSSTNKNMRYFSYYGKSDDGESHIETISENEIRRNYWPVWYAQMCDRYEQAYVDEHYCFEDCLDYWISTHRAWSVTV